MTNACTKNCKNAYLISKCDCHPRNRRQHLVNAEWGLKSKDLFLQVCCDIQTAIVSQFLEEEITYCSSFSGGTTSTNDLLRNYGANVFIRWVLSPEKVVSGDLCGN